MMMIGHPLRGLLGTQLVLAEIPVKVADVENGPYC